MTFWIGNDDSPTKTTEFSLFLEQTDYVKAVIFVLEKTEEYNIKVQAIRMVPGDVEIEIDTNRIDWDTVLCPVFY